MNTLLRKPAGLLLAAMLLAALVPVFLFSRATTHAATSTPTLSVSNDIVHVGQTIMVTGTGFASGENINLELDTPASNFLGSYPCDTTGTCSATITITLYPDAPQGSYPLVATGATSGEVAQVLLSLRPSISLGVPQAGAGTRGTSGSGSGAIRVGPGTEIVVSGLAFAANETVQVYLGTSLTGTLESTPTADATGTIRTFFTTPTTLTPGFYIVTVARVKQQPSQLTGHFTIIPPQITNTPGIHSGQSIRIKLQGFQASEQVTISWNANGGQQLGTTYVDPTGVAYICFIASSVNCITPPSAPPGSYILTATGTASGLRATSVLNVGPGIVLDTPFGGPGSIITVKAGGYSANETVNVYFQTAKNGVVSATTDATGAFSTQLTLPTTYSQGVKYYVYAVNIVGTEHSRALFTFTPPSFPYPDYPVFDEPYGIFGAGFQAHEIVDLYWNYREPGQTKVGSVTTDNIGSFSLTIMAPSSPELGSLTIAAIGTTSKLKATLMTTEQGALYLNPVQGPPGTKIHIEGGGFNSHESVTVEFNSTIIATVTASAGGAFSTTYAVPAGTLSGGQSVTAVGAASGLVFTASFNVLPTLKISPTHGTSGTTITVTGQGYGMLVSVSVYWYDPGTGTQTYLTSASTDFSGNFQTPITAPSGLVSGNTYYVQVDPWAFAPFVQAAFTAQ